MRRGKEPIKGALQGFAILGVEGEGKGGGGPSGLLCLQWAGPAERRALIKAAGCRSGRGLAVRPPSGRACRYGRSLRKGGGGRREARPSLLPAGPGAKAAPGRKRARCACACMRVRKVRVRLRVRAHAFKARDAARGPSALRPSPSLPLARRPRAKRAAEARTPPRAPPGGGGARHPASAPTCLAPPPAVSSSSSAARRARAPLRAPALGTQPVAPAAAAPAGTEASLQTPTQGPFPRKHFPSPLGQTAEPHHLLPGSGGASGGRG